MMAKEGREFCKRLSIYRKKMLEETLIASIGPVTSKTLQNYNIPIHIESLRYDIPGLIEAMEIYFSREG